jgi:hypothetical protein
MKRSLSISLILVCLLSTSSAAFVSSAGILNGTIKDPRGAVIVGAQISVRNDTTGESRDTTTDAAGRFKIEGLAPGSYKVTVSSPGFKTAESQVVIEDTRTVAVEIKLEVAGVRTEIAVPGKGGVAANSDPNYRALRDSASFESFTVSNLSLKQDVGILNLHSGSVSFLPPVMGRVAMAVFVGRGEFTLTPTLTLEKDYLRLITEKESINEAFERAVFCFTDNTYEEIKRQAHADATDQRAGNVLSDFYGRVRRRTERPRSMVEYLLAYEGIENIEAEILAALYNPKRPGFFSAYIFGQKFGDLRFHVRPRGALPQMLAPEEVALINVSAGDDKEGILYLAHLESEYKAGTASSDEDKRIIDAVHYRIETAIDGGEKLTASAEVTFSALTEGDRVLNFGLLPNLRVTRVTIPGGSEVSYIQENKKEDGSLYIILPSAMVKGREYKLLIEYQGNKVIEDAGGGNFAVGARTSWYPSVNEFNDRATFDLTFKVPSKYVLIGVGKLAKEWKEEGFAASQWVSDVPLAVAGFNYGAFKKKEVADPDTKYQIEGYATPELPAYLKGAEGIGGMTPTRLTDKAIVEAQNSIRIFSDWFGAPPYGRIAITQQPQPNFGQSWPTLVYLPIIAFFDSTQRWMLMGGVNSRLTEFIQEVTPHEVAHQWWGHIVGWSSFHDQWLSEGFADFSVGLYLQLTEKSMDKYLTYLQRGRETILEKNQYGRRANDAGPIWMGLRLNTFKTGGAYSRLVYPKGGYILHMLRMMMWDQKTRDQDFKLMMHDFVKSHFNKNASTESFKLVLERHMKPVMDLDKNGKMDWFFNQWVFGTEVPRYRLDYSLTPEADGKVVLSGTLKQTEVSDRFMGLVGIYVEIDGKTARLGQAAVAGRTPTEFKVRLAQKPKRVFLNAYYDVLATDSSSGEK